MINCGAGVPKTVQATTLALNTIPPDESYLQYKNKAKSSLLNISPANQQLYQLILAAV